MNAVHARPKRPAASAKLSRETAVLSGLSAELDAVTLDIAFDWQAFIRRVAVVSPVDRGALRRKAELVMRITEVIQPDPKTDAGCLSWLLESLAADIIAGAAE